MKIGWRANLKHMLTDLVYLGQDTNRWRLPVDGFVGGQGTISFLALLRFIYDSLTATLR